MEWTKETPTEPGVYWHKARSSVGQVVEVEIRDGRAFGWCMGEEDPWPCDGFFPEAINRWYGPIQHPPASPTARRAGERGR